MSMTTNLKRALALVFACAGFSAPVFAEGDPAPTIQREAAMQRYKGCHFTDEMGKYLYECVKKNDGFGTHWCYDETLEVFCPDQLAARKEAEGGIAQDKPAN
jgi:predicted lipoprotein with Yx(FWY)xxD motif